MSPCLIIDRPFLSKPLLASEDARNLWLVEVVVNCPEDGYFTVLVPVFWLLIFPTPSDIMFTCLGEHGVSVLFGIEHLTYSFSTQTEYNPKPFSGTTFHWKGRFLRLTLRIIIDYNLFCICRMWLESASIWINDTIQLLPLGVLPVIGF